MILLAIVSLSLSPPMACPPPLGNSDSLAQSAFLKASNSDASDLFGSVVAISGDTAVVGAWSEDSNSTGVDGDQSWNLTSAAGAAYVFRRNGPAWTQEAYLKASNTEGGDLFGFSVAISGDTIVIGAKQEDSGATGVNGNQNNGAAASGAAYVFVRQGTTWSQEAFLKASNTGGSDAFGTAVAISGDTIVVGAPLEKSAATGVDGDQSNNNATSAGAAYVFVRSGTTWTQEAYLKASNTAGGDLFGLSVAVSGSVVVVGAPGEDNQATGVNGNQSGGWAGDSGAAYVFERIGGTWAQAAYLKSFAGGSDTEVGYSVAASRRRVLVGAPKNPGAAYTYYRSATGWEMESALASSNNEMGDGFGWSVSTESDQLIVGAPFEWSRAIGVDGDQDDNSAFGSGAAYTFVLDSGVWTQDHYLKSSDGPGNGNRFGMSVGLAGATRIVGAPFTDGGAVGVNGSSPLNLNSPGAAHVFGIDIAASPGIPVCLGDGSGTACPCASGPAGSGCANSTGQGASLQGFGSAEFANDSFGLQVSGLRPNSKGRFFASTATRDGALGVPFSAGLLCISAPGIRSKVVVADPNGNLLMPDWDGAPFGSTPGASYYGGPMYYQWWYRDAANPCPQGDFNYSNAWMVNWSL